MAPAFSSAKEAALFALLLLVLLVAPLLMKASWLPPREQVYASISWHIGNYPYLQDQIFKEKGDIDIAFIGSSQIGTAIDTPYVQKQLSERIGRQATVVSLCWGDPGMDLYYFIAKDLLEHRKVRMFVFYYDRGDDAPHKYSWHLVRYNESLADLAPLPIRQKLVYYYGTILSMSRNWLSLLRPNYPANLSPDKVEQIKTNRNGLPFENLGAWQAEKGYNYSIAAYAPYFPTTGAQPSDASVYSAEAESNYSFSGKPFPPLQAYFARKFCSLAQADGVKLVCLSLPWATDTLSNKIDESVSWKEAVDSPVDFLGIPTATFFGNLSTEDIRKLYEDERHLNRNGQLYLTPLLTPKLIDLYEQAQH